MIYRVYTLALDDSIIVNEHESNSLHRAEDHFRANVDAEVNLAVKDANYGGAIVHLYDTIENRLIDAHTVEPN